MNYPYYAYYTLSHIVITFQEKDAQQRLANQKTEYETTIQRHLGFIDQLIADKKDLSAKVSVEYGTMSIFDT